MKSTKIYLLCNLCIITAACVLQPLNAGDLITIICNEDTQVQAPKSLVKYFRPASEGWRETSSPIDFSHISEREKLTPDQTPLMQDQLHTPGAVRAFTLALTYLDAEKGLETLFGKLSAAEIVAIYTLARFHQIPDYMQEACQEFLLSNAAIDDPESIIITDDTLPILEDAAASGIKKNNDTCSALYLYGILVQHGHAIDAATDTALIALGNNDCLVKKAIYDLSNTLHEASKTYALDEPTKDKINCLATRVKSFESKHITRTERWS